MIDQVSTFVDDVTLAAVLGRNGHLDGLVAQFAQDLVQALVQEIVGIGACLGLAGPFQNQIIEFFQDGVMSWGHARISYLNFKPA